jgi:thiazole/oxazole-forming peptide maturase SagD family component
MSEATAAGASSGSGLALRLRTGSAVPVRRLEQRIYSPICGLLTIVGYGTRGRHGGRMVMASGELTGVHVLHGKTIPARPGSFHLGGFGFLPGEAEIKLLGEAVERYAGYAAAASGRYPIRYCSHQALERSGEAVLPADAFRLFTPGQFDQPGFPFVPFASDEAIGWVQARSLTERSPCWVPAQQFLYGYQIRAAEPRYQTAVTTGTSVHPRACRAFIGALEELIQIDAALGHWHGRTSTVRITLDHRTKALNQVIEHYLPVQAPRPEFHLLPSADLPGFSVACLLRSMGKAVPRIVVGLGSGARLCHAMYHAFLEATGVQWLATWILVSHAIGFGTAADAESGPQPGYDLESNVGYYATSIGAKVVEARFADAPDVNAADLPPDVDQAPQAIARAMVRAFASTGKRLYYANLTTRDIDALGLTAMRVWCPDTLALPLPSAPQAAHPRFDDYGGFARHDAHPYP